MFVSFTLGKMIIYLIVEIKIINDLLLILLAIKKQWNICATGLYNIHVRIFILS